MAIGEDVDEGILDVPRGWVQEAGLANVAFLAGDVNGLDLEGDFDAVSGAAGSAVTRGGVRRMRGPGRRRGGTASSATSSREPSRRRGR